MTDNKKSAAFSFPSDREIVMTRIFDAKREVVYRVYTDPHLIPQWWGPKILVTKVDKMDVRRGGIWRFIQEGPDGAKYAFNGVYKEIVPQERVVSTFEFEGMPGHLVTETATLEENEEKTLLRVRSVFQTVEDRDGMINSGMQKGAIESLDRLEVLLEREKKSQKRE